MNDSKQPLISELSGLINVSKVDLNESKASEGKIKNSTQANVTQMASQKEKQAKTVARFLEKAKNYEQKKTYKQFCLRNQLRLKELQKIPAKPQIDHNSNRLAKRKHETPLYNRVNEEVKKQVNNLESLRSLFLLSKTETSGSREDLPKKKRAFTGYSQKTLAWVNTQEDWRKKKERNLQTLFTEIYDEERNKRNRINLTMSQPNITTTSNYLKTFTLANLTKSNLNIRKELIKQENTMPFSPKLNRNRSTKSKLLPECLPMTLNPKKRVKSTVASQPKPKKYPLDQPIVKKKKKVTEHWTRILLKLARNNNLTDESLYRLNISTTGAWNENCINSVDITHGHNVKIISNFIEK